MNNIIIEAIVTSTTVADIGKNIKDGEDFDYTVAIPKYDEYTGAEKDDAEHYHLTPVWLEQKISDATKILDNLKAMKVILTDKDVPVIADYTPKPVEEPPVEEPIEEPVEEP